MSVPSFLHPRTLHSVPQSHILRPSSSLRRITEMDLSRNVCFLRLMAEVGLWISGRYGGGRGRFRRTHLVMVQSALPKTFFATSSKQEASSARE